MRYGRKLLLNIQADRNAPNQMWNFLLMFWWRRDERKGRYDTARYYLLIYRLTITRLTECGSSSSCFVGRKDERQGRCNTVGNYLLIYRLIITRLTECGSSSLCFVGERVGAIR